MSLRSLRNALHSPSNSNMSCTLSHGWIPWTCVCVSICIAQAFQVIRELQHFLPLLKLCHLQCTWYLTMWLTLSSWWPWIIHRIFTMAQELVSSCVAIGCEYLRPYSVYESALSACVYMCQYISVCIMCQHISVCMLCVWPPITYH